MAVDAVIFDVDGTLVDTNALHVQAWRRALAESGFQIAEDRIFQEVGKGGDMLVPAILGRRADHDCGPALRAAQPREYARLAGERGVRVFEGVRELFAVLRQRGIRTVLSTSSNQKQLRTTSQASGLDLAELADLLVTSDDAATSKPAPDLVTAAVRKLDMTPAQCAMIGDTPYDAQACRRAGVACLGVTCGGCSPRRLLAAGARAVWESPADLLAHLEAALESASPGPAHWTRSLLEALMGEALAAAREGLEAGEAPIGCVLGRGDGSVLARGYNQLMATGDKTAHAEMVTFAAAAGKIPLAARDLVLVSTLEPCVMCTGAAMEAAVDLIIYGLKAPADAGTNRVRPPCSAESQMPRIVGEVMAQQSRALFESWLQRNPNPRQATYVRQLLGQEG
jgi:HAD superfamily hydrolase (TIGR01509 family)